MCRWFDFSLKGENKSRVSLGCTQNSVYNMLVLFLYSDYFKLMSLETVVILLVLFAFALEAVCPVAVVSATLAAVGSDAEARVGLRQGVHTQDFVDLPEGQQPEGKLGAGGDVLPLLLSQCYQSVHLLLLAGIHQAWTTGE